jgi:hypothetical protein
MDYVDEKDVDRFKEAKNEVEVVDRVTSDFLAVYNRWQPFYERARRAYDAVVGESLSPEAHEEMEADRRPNEVLNFLLPMVNTISGMIAGNKLAIKANPMRRGDEQGASFKTVLVSDYAMGLCNGYRESAKSHTDAAVGGMGWTTNYYDMDLRQWITRAYDPFMCMNDPDAISESDDDSRYRFVSAYYGVDEILNIFDLDPEIADAIKKQAADTEGTKKNIKSSKWLDRIYGGAAELVKNADRYASLTNSMVDLNNGIYRVIEFHDKRRIETGYLFNPLSREVKEVEEEIANDKQKKSELLQAHPRTQGWLYTTEKRDEIWTIAVCPTLSPNRCLINKKHPIQGQGFQHKPTYWYSYHPDKTKTRGILDNLLALNDYFSKLTMTRLEAVLRGVFPDVTVEDGTLDPEMLKEWESKEIGKIKRYKAQHPKPEREKIMTEVIASLGNLSEEFFELRNELSGMPKASMGFQDSSKETGILYKQKVMMGAISTETPNDHIRRNMENLFNYCAEGLRAFMTLPEEIRVLGEPPEGLEGVEMDQATQDAYWLKVNWETGLKKINDVSAGQYDFRADTTQLGQTGKMAMFAQDMDLLKIAQNVLPEAAARMLPMVLRESDSPSAKEMAKVAEEEMKKKLGIQENINQKKIIGSDLALAGQAKQLMQPEAQPQEAEAQNAA